MKIRCYPKKSVVMDMLQNKLDDANAKIFNIEARIENAYKPGAAYANTTADRGELSFQNGIAEDLTEKLMVLASHTPEEVMVEIES